MASTLQIWPVDDTTASTCTGPHRVSMVGPSTVLPVHVEPADGCAVLAGGLVVAAGWLITVRVAGVTAGVVDETAGGVVTVGAVDAGVGSVEVGSAAASPPRPTPKPCAVPPPVGRSSNATRPAAAEVRTNAGSSRLPSD